MMGINYKVFGRYIVEKKKHELLLQINYYSHGVYEN